VEIVFHVFFVCKKWYNEKEKRDKEIKNTKLKKGKDKNMKQEKFKILKILSFFFVFCFLFFVFSNFSHSATFISTSQKEVIRDSKRLNDLTIFRKAIEDYKTKNGYYPKLESGTNIKGYVNSVWSSQWTSFCNLVGLSSCPIDPINEIVGCDCKVFSVDGKCSGDNINSNIDTSSCYNSKSQSFACTSGSNFYQYQSLNNGRNYSLMMEFEYANNVNWDIDSSTSDNYVIIKNTCTSGSNFYKVYSNRLPKCGDGILSYSEVCEVGSKKTEYCKTADNKTGIRYVNCSNSCVWDTANVGNCLTVGFCGDGIIQPDKGEECDGGYQKMCYSYQDYSGRNIDDEFANSSHHNWYNEQLRYCGLNCKWNSNFIDSTFYCGGFCGDGIVQTERGEECDNSSDAHCNQLTCKNSNSVPKIKFDFFNNRNSKNSYIKSSVWSGSNLEYPSDYNGSGNSDLIIADKHGNDYVAVWNSDFIEIKVDGEDEDGDVLSYKYYFEKKYNIGLKIKYKDLSTNKFIDYVDGSYIKSNIIRVYPTSVDNGSNLRNKNKDFVFGQSYVGPYSLRVMAFDSYNRGVNSSTNLLNASDIYNVDFKIGPGCGDRILQKDLGEICEFKPNESVTNIFTDWIIGKPENNTDNHCAVADFNFSGKWRDVSCLESHYGLCERRASFGCDGWISGNSDNCYLFTSGSKTWNDAKTECESYNGKLSTIDDLKESKFVKSDFTISAKNIFWLGYKTSNSLWYAEYGTYWRPDADNKNSFRNKFFLGGVGTSITDQYSCGLPWNSDACRFNNGFLGDETVNPMFEECDYTDKTSYGKGTNQYNTYECKADRFSCTINIASANYYRDKTYTCSYYSDNVANPDKLKNILSGGYCGDGFLENNYEHCDPKDRITAADSSSVSFGLGTSSKQYVCKSDGDSYNDIDDYNATKNNDVNRACRKSYGGYCGDGIIQMFYSLDSNNNYVISDNDKNNQSGLDWKKIFYDTISKKHYFLEGINKTYFTNDQENMFIEECDNDGFISPTPINSNFLNQYGTCGENSNSKDVCVRNYDSYGRIISYDGNCSCRKLNGGYCGDGSLQGSYGETCDIASSLLGIDNLSVQFCSYCTKMDCDSGLNIISSTVYLVRKNVTVGAYTGSFAIMNALSASQDGDFVYIGGNAFDFSDDYSIDLNDRNITINSCISTVWNWK